MREMVNVTEKERIVTVNSIELGNYVLSKLKEVSHLKLQKLVYYIQAWHLAIFERPLIEDTFEA